MLSPTHNKTFLKHLEHHSSPTVAGLRAPVPAGRLKDGLFELSIHGFNPSMEPRFHFFRSQLTEGLEGHSLAF